MVCILLFLCILKIFICHSFKAPRAHKITREEESAARLAQLPGIQALGPVHRTTSAIQLTESETEYTVSCIKHIFSTHIVFQV